MGKIRDKYISEKYHKTIARLSVLNGIVQHKIANREYIKLPTGEITVVLELESCCDLWADIEFMDSYDMEHVARLAGYLSISANYGCVVIVL